MARHVLDYRWTKCSRPHTAFLREVEFRQEDQVSLGPRFCHTDYPGISMITEWNGLLCLSVSQTPELS
jgi:hypothetical protein